MSLVALDWQVVSSVVAVSLFTFVLSYLGSGAALRLAKHSGMIVQPGARQSHQVATPTGGGLGLLFSVIVTTAVIQLFMPLPVFWWLYMLPGVVLLAVAGWLDDRNCWGGYSFSLLSAFGW